MFFRSVSLAFSLALAIFLTTAATTAEPAAAGIAPSFAPYVEDAFQRYGWTQPARAFVRGRIDLTTDPSDLPNTRNLAGMYWSSRIVIWDPFKLGDWMYETITHEYGHALEDARGENPATMGPVLYDMLHLSQDPAYPDAAWAARHLLQLDGSSTGDWMLDGYYASMLDRGDYAHLLLAVLERGAAFDVGRLPPWFRAAYFPHLSPNPPNPYPVRVMAHPSRRPDDYDRRLLRVKNLIAELCGPIMPGATARPTSGCTQRKRWPGVPFDPLPGAEGRGPAAPASLSQPIATPAAGPARTPVTAPTTSPAQAVEQVPAPPPTELVLPAEDAQDETQPEDTAVTDDTDPDAAQTTDTAS